MKGFGELHHALVQCFFVPQPRVAKKWGIKTRCIRRGGNLVAPVNEHAVFFKQH